jgi:hypothetical protein
VPTSTQSSTRLAPAGWGTVGRVCVIWFPFGDGRPHQSRIARLLRRDGEGPKRPGLTRANTGARYWDGTTQCLRGYKAMIAVRARAPAGHRRPCRRGQWLAFFVHDFHSTPNGGTSLRGLQLILFASTQRSSEQALAAVVGDPQERVNAQRTSMDDYMNGIGGYCFPPPPQKQGAMMDGFRVVMPGFVSHDELPPPATDPAELSQRAPEIIKRINPLLPCPRILTALVAVV